MSVSEVVTAVVGSLVAYVLVAALISQVIVGGVAVTFSQGFFTTGLAGSSSFFYVGSSVFDGGMLNVGFGARQFSTGDNLLIQAVPIVAAAGVAVVILKKVMGS